MSAINGFISSGSSTTSEYLFSMPFFDFSIFVIIAVSLPVFSFLSLNTKQIPKEFISSFFNLGL